MSSQKFFEISGEKTVPVEFDQQKISLTLHRSDDDSVYVDIKGPPGQSADSVAFSKKMIIDPASDDMSWLKSGTDVTINGATNATAKDNIFGKTKQVRIESRILEEELQQAIENGERNIKIDAHGQHGIGGRLHRAGDEKVYILIEGHPGQRTGSMGFPNTRIEIMGPASDDVGWLNAGAEIIIHGNAANGAANAMAQGKIFIDGNIGARGMTMTKSNPRFDPPELWILGTAGDYFAEFMAGGVAIICGHEGQNPENVIGYRPTVGMVGGKIFFRGPINGFSTADAKQIPVSDTDWKWLSDNMVLFLENINKPELLSTLTKRSEWQLLTALSPQEKTIDTRRSMASFRQGVWDAELGTGGLIGELTDIDMSPVPVIATGKLRRFVPVWENNMYLAPCQAACPSGIPVQQRWGLMREDKTEQALEIALDYTPFPATICGYLCPNLCMDSCTKHADILVPIDVTVLGKKSIDIDAKANVPPESGKKIAVIGGGPAGISVAWQLRKQGHTAVIYDRAEKLGGKIESVIPNSRIPKDVFKKELERAASVIPHVHLKENLTAAEFEKIASDFDFTVISIGAQKPVVPPFPGNEKLVPALDFLFKAKAGSIKPGKRVVIIGAGNVGCDVATEAHRLGADDITLIDIQEPASFGLERDEAERAGAKFLWPKFTKEITDDGVVLTDGELLPADTVVISIGDRPDLDFIPEGVSIDRGFVSVNAAYQTTIPNIFAIGDVVRPGLLTNAIGAGRKAATTIIEVLSGKRPLEDTSPVFSDGKPAIDKSRVSLAYFDPRIIESNTLGDCASQCSSCGKCRDCGICVSACPQAAISRIEVADDAGYEYTVNDDLCIGCGFCAGACPCGIWDIVQNSAF